MSQDSSAVDLRQPLPLARLLWFGWLPWLVVLFGWAIFASDVSRSMVGPLLGISWLATGVSMMIAAFAFKAGLASSAPDVLLEYGVFGGFWSQIDMFRLIGAARDVRVKSSPVLAELASRHVALTVGTFSVFCLAALVMIVFR